MFSPDFQGVQYVVKSSKFSSRFSYNYILNNSFSEINSSWAKNICWSSKFYESQVWSQKMVTSWLKKDFLYLFEQVVFDQLSIHCTVQPSLHNKPWHISRNKSMSLLREKQKKIRFILPLILNKSSRVFYSFIFKYRFMIHGFKVII